MKIVGYAYIAKPSGTLTLVREDQKHLPHVFPLYTHDEEEDKNKKEGEDA